MPIARLSAAFIVVLSFGLLVGSGGCAPKWQELKKPTRQQSFVLSKDYTRTETRGIGVKKLEGLRAGVYTLAAEDAEGLFFGGTDACVIKLSGDAGDEFLKTGQSKYGFLPGGLWLPKPGVEKGAKLFYIFGGKPTGNAGVLVDAIIASGKGDVIFVDYASEKDFVKSLAMSPE